MLDEHGKPRSDAIKLDYEPRERRRDPTFRFGVVSVALPILVICLALVTQGVAMPWSACNLLLEAGGVLCIGGLCTGVVGLYRRSGRDWALWGIVMSICVLVILPAFARA